MDLSKFTDRARGFLQSAQTLALREQHQRLTAEHMLHVLLQDETGLARTLIGSAGGDTTVAAQGAEAAVSKLPKVSGGNGQIYMDTGLARLLDEAGRIAEKAGDSVVTVERILMALAMAKGTEAATILASAGVKPQALEKAIQALRKGRTADSASAEDSYDALKKYARDLTEDARA
ncbi:MAG: Clp protease N-terminal domain-containing protein, partial [Pseudomonadota bacterium]